MKKIVYFTAGATATVEEIADIEALNALAEKPYTVNVCNGSVPANLGNLPADPDAEPDPLPVRPAPKSCDYVAGTVPDDLYDNIPVFDLDEPPAPDNLAPNQAVVYDGLELEIGEATYTFTVVDGVITAIATD